MTQRHRNDDPITPTLRVLACTKCGDRHTVDVSSVVSLHVERLAPYLAVEFGKAGFFAPKASMEFLTQQARLMLADALLAALGES